jgi:two-component system NtrC family sensor kinase
MSPKVLFVDDDNDNLLVCQALCAGDFEVLTASSGAAALELMRSHEVAIIVSDHRMPQMSGVELLERARSEFPDTVRVLVTAYSDAHAAVDAINRGRVSRFLRKPWQPNELAAILADGLDRYLTGRRLKELERRLIQTERVYALGIVAAGIGHELRNPISWICANVEHSLGELADVSSALGAGDVALAAAKVEGIRGALLDANCGAERVREIVSAIRVSTVSAPVDNELVELEEVARLGLRLVEADTRRAVQVDVEAGGDARVNGSRAQLSQIIVNLLVNAIHAVSARPRDGALIRVRIGSDGPLACLEVSDSGAGVPEQDRERIFDPFFTTKPGVGTGLGLAISRKIALELGGWLDVGRDARLGGAVFRLTLPAARKPQLEVASRDQCST